MSDDNQGNPIRTIEDSIVGSKGDFFDALEQDVNGVVAQGGEGTQQTTQETRSESGPKAFMPKETPNTSQGPNNVDWEKRYKDSSREAVKMATTLNQLKPFVPVLEAMKRDSGLVDHVRDYLKSGGSPDKSIKEKLKLDEDFEYDPNEAMSDPELQFPANMIAAATSLAQGYANVTAIQNAINQMSSGGGAATQAFQEGGYVGGRRHSQGGTIIEAEQGEFVMSRNAVESIGIETLNRMNLEGGGGGVNITVTGNVLTQDFVEGELAESIKEALRRGSDFGIS